MAATQVESSREQARARVIELFKSRGPTVADDARNFDALLRDRFAGSFRGERSALVLAAAEGIPKQLRRASSSESGRRLVYARVSETLRDGLFLDPASANWVAETYAIALFGEVLAPADGRNTHNEVVPEPTDPQPRTTTANNGVRRIFAAYCIATIAAGCALIAIYLVGTPPQPVQFAVSPTHSCQSPNAADAHEMEQAIVHFNAAVSERHNWAQALQYEDDAVFQNLQNLASTYAHTRSSSAANFRPNGCEVTADVRVQDDDGVSKCSVVNFAMEAAPSIGRSQPHWIIRGVQASEKDGLCPS